MCIDTCQIWIDMSSKGEHHILLVVDHHHKVVIDKEPDEENRMNSTSSLIGRQSCLHKPFNSASSGLVPCKRPEQL